MGSITVSLSRSQSDEDATIVYADGGPGFVETGECKRCGLEFVKRLMEQIGGTVSFRSDHGAEWSLAFPVTIVRPSIPSVARP